jgi:hypothetical protein
LSRRDQRALRPELPEKSAVQREPRASANIRQKESWAKTVSLGQSGSASSITPAKDTDIRQGRISAPPKRSPTRFTAALTHKLVRLARMTRIF